MKHLIGLLMLITTSCCYVNESSTNNRTNDTLNTEQLYPDTTNFKALIDGEVVDMQVVSYEPKN